MPRVAEVLIARGDGFVTEVTGEVMLQFGGFAGDRHFGLTRASDSRTPWHPRGTVIGNTRQISIVSIEECAAVAQDMGIARIYPSWLGANLAFKNVADLSAMPPSTRILFPSGATLFVTEENVPADSRLRSSRMNMDILSWPAPLSKPPLGDAASSRSLSARDLSKQTTG